VQHSIIGKNLSIIGGSLEIVYYKIMSLHKSESPGPDGWPIPIIKSVSEFFAIPLSIIFSKSFNSGTLPQDWKRA